MYRSDLTTTDSWSCILEFIACSTSDWRCLEPLNFVKGGARGSVFDVVFIDLLECDLARFEGSSLHFNNTVFFTGVGFRKQTALFWVVFIRFELFLVVVVLLIVEGEFFHLKNYYQTSQNCFWKNSYKHWISFMVFDKLHGNRLWRMQ